MRNKVLVEGDVNLLGLNEILVTKSEGYTILRERMPDRSIKTFVIVPLEDFQSNKPSTEKATKKQSKSKTTEDNGKSEASNP
jgi:hypothetical protein